MTMKWLEDSEDDFHNQRVLCRVDFNVPLDENGEITDASRIVKTLPTLEFLLGRGARLILASHLGRPKGKTRAAMSLEPVAVKLQELLGKEVVFVDDCVGDGVNHIIKKQKPGSVILLENLRFHSGEEKNDSLFSKMLAENADVYVNDAFGAAHREHASVTGILNYTKNNYGGLLLKQEVKALSSLLNKPKKPFVAILGGSKVSDKLGTIGYLLNRVDRLLIGGAMAYTFLAAKGQSVGASLVEEDRIGLVKSIMEQAEREGVELYLPVDHVVASEFSKDAACRIISINEFESDEMALDIGPITQKRYVEAIEDANTIFWNGPMGVFEWPSFSEGTYKIADAVAKSSGYSVVGGGDSVAAVVQRGCSDGISHVSTGGGASLEFMQGKILPGLAKLES